MVTEMFLFKLYSNISHRLANVPFKSLVDTRVLHVRDLHRVMFIFTVEEDKTNKHPNNGTD